MKQAIVLVMVIVAVGLIVRYELERTSQRKRQAFYLANLATYAQALKPGMTRKEVESYLRARNADFTQTCCVDSKEAGRRHSWDDLVRLGQEEHPWYCGRHNVYVAFQFADYTQDQRPDDNRMQDDDLDTLRAVALYDTLEQCL
jgi:hypothetical protein